MAGGKAANLYRLIGAGFNVPEGICIASAVYDMFMEQTGAKDFISYELGRKDLDNMRWEEMWDAALRIRNFFLRAEYPENIKNEILGNIPGTLLTEPVAVRSSSNFEDSGINSYAGLHESFLNVQGEKEILKKVKLVWASLWSDAAIAYSRELGLDKGEGRMGVVIQEMVPGKVSGVAFGVSPVNENASVIEAVAGLNQGLVDGDVEPDRWELDRLSGRICGYEPANESKRTVMAAEGTRIVAGDRSGARLLPDDRVLEVYKALRELERHLDYIPDMEWTFKGENLYILQVRPVTTSKFEDNDLRRAWDMTLRRSVDNLKVLSRKILNELIPSLVKDAEEMENVDLEAFNDTELADELEKRNEISRKWKDIYWDEFIPFAHGVRIFGQIYNDRVDPEDPYEFITLLTGDGLISVKRNDRLRELAAKLKERPEILSNEGGLNDPEFEKELNGVIAEFDLASGDQGDPKTKLSRVISFLKKFPAKSPGNNKELMAGRDRLRKDFLKTFPEDEKQQALELLDLARTSYKLRDDDNIYLGRIENELLRAMAFSREKLGVKCADPGKCQAAEEVIKALKMPGYFPEERKEDANEPVAQVTERRQLRGQPAGKGIARGRARIIRSRSDLFELEDGEIIVCDSIDPGMTFIIPVCGGIIESRGGMLIHGAIIAREYGIPCVTGIQGAANNINTGDDVTVDGYFGLVINHSVGKI